MRYPTTRHVAVLGAGIMGSSIALFLARSGVRVTLFDAALAPFSRVSRWNEGKIHLGFLYSGDRSMATARRLLPGALRFRELTEELIGCSLAEAVTRTDEIYLTHRNSVVDADAMRQHFQAVMELARTHPDAGGYLCCLSHGGVRSLSRSELQELADPEQIIAGYALPERSVRTAWIADRFVEALAAESQIELVMGTRVKAVRSSDAACERDWFVESEPPAGSSFDAVVNALWEGGIAVDETLGLRPEAQWSHRLRLSLFVRTARPVECPSVVLAAGPFGDVKNYTGRDFYLSWYEAGLIAEGRAVAAPEVPLLNAAQRQKIADAVVDKLSGVLPAVRRIAKEAVEMRLEGGWVFAIGEGSLADPRSTLHRRDRLGMRWLGTYISVNTGKYSIAPWLARQVADHLLA
jgi:glycine/D-amino acid oxidase-like deaminating enzyme